MATAPQLEARDGSGYTTALNFTTNQEAVVIRGTVTTDTVALQVSVNGGAFVTDPNLLKIELNTFSFPNPAAYSSGFILSPGINTVAFRAIDIIGGVSGTSTATITQVDTSDAFNAATTIPTGLKVARRRGGVDLLVSRGIEILYQKVFIGYNVYASKTPAGKTGYYKVNEAPLPMTGDVYEDFVTDTFPVATSWSDSNHYLLNIRLTEMDEFGNELAVPLNQTIDLSRSYADVRFKGTVEAYNLVTYTKFTHYRGGGLGIINADQWNGVPDTDPLYYVVTTVYFDKSTNTEFESPFSQEVLGAPLLVDTGVIDLPNRTQTAIVTDYINYVGRVNNEISLIPGSTTRDVSIDPFASEAERLWFLMDFVHRSQSFLTLMQMDNALGGETSDAVLTSPYKYALRSALGYTSDRAVQNLIDLQFDKLARNVNKARLGGRSAVGQVVFYTTSKPSIDIIIPAGVELKAAGVATSFRVGGSYILPAANAEAFYNYTTKRYEVVADVAALNPGADGNVPPGSITGNSGVSGLSVTNVESLVGGTDVESNYDLATRCMLAFVSVDTGTENGYYQTAAEQVGIIKSKVVKSGDRLMMRDWDEVRKKHIGGKVDVWVQGLRERQVTEKFSFSFNLAQNIQCSLVDLTTLTFRVLDSRVTATTPIIEMLNDPTQGYGVRNATLGADYDLSGVQVIDFQTFRLNTSIAQPVTTLDDVVYADYRFRSENQFIPSLQPVRRVTSVVGESSGALDASVNFNLYRLEDPLLQGESTAAKDYLSVVQANGKPAGSQILVNDEAHVLIGFVQEPLDSIGINTNTVRVFNSDRSIEYTVGVDFEIVGGTDRTPINIVRTSASTILTGQPVVVDYTKDENFTVTYVVNDLLQQFQTVLNNRRHATADVLAKQAIVNSVEIETTVQLKSGAAKDKVDPLVRANLSVELNSRVIGQGVAQSDVIKAIDGTSGVDYEVVPLARMAYADGALILREQVLSSSTYIAGLDAGGQRVYLLNDALNYPTTDGGGLATEHRGVFQDDIALTLVDNLLLVGSQPNQAYIIGNSGAVLPGFTDVTTAATVANKVLVSISGAGVVPDVPANHSYSVSYRVRGDKGPHDVYGSEVEYLDLGNFTVTYRAG